MSCSHCGTKVREHTKYCPECGRVIKMSEEGERAPKVPEKKRPIESLQAFHNELSPSTGITWMKFSMSDDKQAKLDLLDEEEVVVRFSKKINFIPELGIGLLVMILSAIAAFIIIWLFVLISKPFGPHLSNYLIFSLVMSTIVLIISGVLYKDVSKISKKKEQVQVPWSKLRAYPEVIVLTNKRCIQESYGVRDFDFSKYKNYIVKKDSDVIVIEIQTIKIAITYGTLQTGNYINFYLTPEEKKVPVLQLGFFTLASRKLSKFLQVLESNCSIKREDRNDGITISFL